MLIKYLEAAYRLFIQDEDDWCTQGRYESILGRTPTPEDYIKWVKDGDKEFIRVLGVSLYIYLSIHIYIDEFIK